MPFIHILEMWKYYNLLLSYVIENIDINCRSNIWIIKGKEITLEELVIDYLRHLNDHLNQFKQRFKEVNKKYNLYVGTTGVELTRMINEFLI